MNIISFGKRFNPEDPQLVLIGNEITSNGYMEYSYLHPESDTVYYRKTSSPLEIAVMTELKFHNLFSVRASLHPELNYSRQHELAIRVEIDQTKIKEYRNISDALRAHISLLFKNIPSYSTGNYPKCDSSFLPNVHPISQPESFKVDLYDYQKRSIAKMIQIENGIKQRFISYKYVIDFNGFKLSYDPILKRYIDDKELLDESKYTLQIKTNGGILSDEMGLGKTLTSLGLVAMNPSKKKIKENEVRTTKTDNGFKIEADSTLIVCPSHLIKQWESEVYKVFPKCRLIKLLTKKDHDKLKYSAIVNADIVIVTQQFLMNFNYYPKLNYRHCTPSNYSADDRDKALDNILASWIKAEENILEKIQPNLEHFNFHRLIVDEAHEVFGLQLSNASQAEYLSRWLSTCSADYKWFVSGTPFVNFNGVINCLKFINCKILLENKWHPYSNLVESYRWNYRDHRSKHSESGIYQKIYMVDQLMNNIMIRHKKEDTNVNIDNYDEEIYWINLTDIEKKIYQSKLTSSRCVLQQLCCHILVSDSVGSIINNKEVSLAEIEQKLIEHNKQAILTYTDKISKLDTSATEYHMLKKNFETKISECKYFLSVIEKISTSKSDNDGEKVEEDCTCPICMDDMENKAITKCGHIFCKECLDMCLQVKKSCPTCKTDLKNTEIYVTDEVKKEEDCLSKNPLIQKYGSKLGKLVSIVRKLVIDENNKIIIFSQWDRMLDLIGSTLKENGVSNSEVKGNVYCKNAAINKFKMNNNTDNVIMLSLSKSASGTNLTEATHILFVEPIDESIDEVKAIEAQAIGRACRIGQKNKVKVIRILTRNTVEEEIYKKNNSVLENAKLTDNFNNIGFSNDNTIEIEV